MPVGPPGSSNEGGANRSFTTLDDREAVPPTSLLRSYHLEQRYMTGTRSMMPMLMLEYKNIGLLILEHVLSKY